MAVTLQSLGIDKLSRTERISLVDQIRDSIAEETKPPLDDPSPTILVLPSRAYLWAMWEIAKSTFGSPFTDSVIDLGPSLIPLNTSAS